ncbi:hypothetical protein ACFQY5_21420 [Paeniroseomonas aquatica]|uniref:hypothetical protein n=1 Tax=Paeniroseomonas aquatica TaxID=373043 RepID=UPI00360713C1
MAFHLGRRHLLRAGLATAALPGLRRLAFAEEPAAARPLLVLVNLRGGMDGLHALSPADDADFVDLRADALRTAASGPRAGHRLEASSAIDFRLHPEAAPLFEIWRDGRMAIWPAAGVPQATRSHFEAQAMMGLGQGLRADPGGATGWLAAWAAGAAEAPVTALSAQGGLAPELRGARQGLGIASLADGLAPPAAPSARRCWKPSTGTTQGMAQGMATASPPGRGGRRWPGCAASTSCCRAMPRAGRRSSPRRPTRRPGNSAGRWRWWRRWRR